MTLKYRPNGPQNTNTYDEDVTAWQGRIAKLLTRPAEQPSEWSATVALLEVITDRAALIYATASEDHLPAMVDDGTAVDGVVQVAEYLYRAALGDPTALDDDTWSSLPGWWQTRLIRQYREQDHDDHAYGRETDHYETTTRKARNVNGTITQQRRRKLQRVGGRPDRTAQGATVPEAMAPYARIAEGTDQTASTAHAAYEAARLMADNGLIPRMLGTDDQMRREETPDLTGAEIEHVSEGQRAIYWPRVRRVIRRADHSFTIVERTGERRREHDRDRTGRVIHTRNLVTEHKVSRVVDYNKPRGERWTETIANAKRKARTDHRADVVRAIAQYVDSAQPYSGPNGTNYEARRVAEGWRVALLKPGKGKKAATLRLIHPDGQEQVVTPRRAATIVANA